MISVTVETGRLEGQMVRLEQALRAGFFRRYAPLAMTVIEREQLRHFREQRAPDGTPWLPSRRAKRQNGQTLVDTSLLRASVSAGSGGGAIRETGPEHLLVGTRVRYGAIHQFGATIPVPARRQTLAFGKGGRFLSRKQAARRKRGAVRVAYVRIGAGVIRIPARPFLGTGPACRQELGTAARLTLRKTLQEAAG